MKSLFLKTFFTAFLAIFLTSCVETVVIGSIATGAVVTREKDLSSTQKDIVISTGLGAAFLKNGLKNPFHSIDVTVNEGRVLLTGITTSPEKAELANELSWKASGVKEVIDEIHVIDGEKGFTKRVSSALGDYVISSTIEAKLFLNSKVRSFNFQITTVDKNVYVLGVAHNRAELNKALDIIAKTSGVAKVVNHAIVADDSRRRGDSSKKGTYKEEDEEAAEIK